MNIVDTPIGAWDHGDKCTLGSIRDLLDILISPALAGRRVGMITAFLDESGTHGPAAKTTVMGGYCGRADQWLQFEKDWTNAHGDEVFHAKEFSRRPDSERDSFVVKSVEILQKNGIFGLIAAIRNDDYVRYRREFGKHIKQMESAYGLCFMACLVRFAETAKAQWPDEVVSFVVEDGHKNVGDANRIFLETKQLYAGHLCKLGTFATASKADYSALQAADLFSYETHGYLDRLITGSAPKRKGYFLDLCVVPSLSSSHTWDSLHEIGTACVHILREYREAGGRPAHRTLYRATPADLTPKLFEKIEPLVRADIDHLLNMDDDIS